MKKDELKGKMEKAKGWVFTYKKRIAGATVAVILVAVCVVSGVAVSTQADGGDDAGTKTVEARLDQNEKKTTETEKSAAEAVKKEETKKTEEKDSDKKKTEEKKKADDKKEAAKDTSETKQAQKTASAASQKSSSSSKESGSSGSGNSSSSSSSQTSNPVAQQPAASAPTEQKPAEPEKPAHVHNWEQQYKTEKTWVDTSWDEEVSEPIYETVEKSICNVCGADVTGNTAAHAKEHALAGEGGGHHSEWVEVQTGTNTYTVHHDDGHWEEHQVPAGYKCSGCGATK